ncbi:MAG: pyridoxal-phosphate dependent enzyme [Thermoplasmata archaeon]|nr:pyridoxal-phosphate dependent enzyme [Thermoplasmata archaeon]
MAGPSAALGSILEAIGGTPVVPLHRLARGLPYTVLAKLEFLNPGGSVKDRIAPAMVDAAEADGLLKPGGTIVEATSGNTGVGLAMVAAVRGYRCVFVLPDKMSSEKVRLLRAYGARVVITPSGLPPEHPMSHYSVARRLSKEIPNACYPNQYVNPANPDAHERTTAPEVDRQGGERLAAVVCTVGTGGTISGIGRYFKKHRPSVRVVGVDPRGSILAHYFATHELAKAHPYKVEGIGEDMIPKTVDFSVIDQFVQVDDRESFLMARRLSREEGLFAGGSSGAAVQGTLAWLKERPLPEGSTVVVLLPDSGDRYLSKFYSDDWMRENRFLDAGATAGTLLLAKEFGPPLLSVDPTTVVRDALALLRHHGISQLPVLAGRENVGALSEEEILRAVLSDQTVLERTVSALLGPAFGEVDREDPVGELLRRLREERALLVRDRGSGELVGLLTRHDLLAYISTSGGADAV